MLDRHDLAGIADELVPTLCDAGLDGASPRAGLLFSNFATDSAGSSASFVVFVVFVVT